jgi:hypothetical protein
MFYVKQKWFSIKNVRRTKGLWDECAQFNQYTELSFFYLAPIYLPFSFLIIPTIRSGDEFIEFGHKLDNFLDAFLTAKEELQKDKSTKLQIDSNYGDCTDILLSLVQIVERYISHVYSSRPVPPRVIHRVAIYQHQTKTNNTNL